MGGTMDLQKAVLEQYKHAYPKDTLKEISSKTNIQITRVFRLLNGSEMKISEYAAFEKCLPTNQSTSEFIQTANQCLTKLEPERKKMLLAQMKHALKINFLKQMLVHPVEMNHFA